MKKIIVFAVVMFASLVTFSQTSEIKLDSLSFRFRDLQDENLLTPLSPSSPNYKESQVEVTIQFTISNLEVLKSIDIVFEKAKNKKDLKIFTLLYAKANGKDYLTYKDKAYEIVGNKVIIVQTVNEMLLKRKIYFSLQATDTQNKTSNTLIKEFN